MKGMKRQAAGQPFSDKKQLLKEKDVKTTALLFSHEFPLENEASSLELLDSAK